MKEKENVAEKKEFIKEHIDAADEQTVNMIYDMLDGNDLLENISPEFEEAIRRGIEQADNGQVIPHEEVMNKFRQWRSK
ncbi:hypothetical protein [Aridibaculum aurantiacum]|uniref:hypothetical protein n=1 Tax=Aridibaculum aurantiacum TaxID=2810307 RepID=UPI001A9607C4|nr:hypothetical protein [Aridibaculum aurantiacum]